MKSRRKAFSLLGVVAYLTGLLLGLGLSGWFSWGGLEGVLFVSQTADMSLKTLRCPWMLAANETGVVTASFNNPTPEEIRPTIRAEISRAKGTRQASLILPIAPGEEKELQWTVDSKDTVFGGLILVSLYESRYADFPSHQGSCGILVSRLPGLTGMQAFFSIMAVSLLLVACGAAVWIAGRKPLKGLERMAAQAGGALAVVVLASMVFTIFHQWVGSGLLVLLASMMIPILVTQFVLFPSGADHGRD
jgi:hypothetical protein